MTCEVKIARAIYERARQDVGRPHEFALERVGFLFGRSTWLGDHQGLILINDFTPVADEDYVPDETAGARINGKSIRAALQRALDRDESVLHFHMHHRRGRPSLSRIDANELERLIPSFGHLVPTQTHGALVASPDSASAWVWMQGRREAVRGVAVVGFPTEVWRT